MTNHTKTALLNFIDQRAFNVILQKNAESLPQKARNRLRFLQRKTKTEQEKFHSYHSAKEVKDNFLDNARSTPAHKLNNGLKEFALPILPELKDDFVALCEKMGV